MNTIIACALTIAALSTLALFHLTPPGRRGICVTGAIGMLIIVAGIALNISKP